MSALLDLDQVSVIYPGDKGAVRAVRGVSLALEAGETLGLVGESGSGKSSLASAILGLQPQSATIEGSIRFDGQDLTSLSAKSFRTLRGTKIATIAQDPFTALNPVVTIGRQLVEFQHWRKDLGQRQRWDRALDMLTRVGLADPETRMKQYAHQLSGGIRQRVAIAAALLTGPKLLIADEPTTALDATTEAQIIEVIRDARQQIDGAIVFITHDMGVVGRLCDKVAVLYAGELVESGPVSEVFANPSHPYTRALLACDPARIEVATRHLPTISGTVPAPDILPPGCVFAPRCPEALPVCSTSRPLFAPAGENRRAACHLVTP